ncbi:MAG TPA: 4-hydroxyphenylacetate 3-hydroxylase N-terminal domain-containing protein, partial [Kofleriaceae bacterium]|nr:4-hydroxyphenylacetate 3-hydroxylase N-terminal domain-containing protein [Kofleriaceae bacterium]
MAVRTGQQYIKAIQAKREVWVNGSVVDNVATYPPFRATVEAIAALYDLQHDPAHRDVLTYGCEETGERCARAFAPPRTVEDLVVRRQAFQIYAESSFGMLGRSPDFLNSAVMAFATAAPFFGGEGTRFHTNIQRYYRHCRERDLFLSHATIPPQVDRSKAASEQADPYAYLRTSKETSDGIYVRGAKMIGTLAPLADELLVFNMPGLRPGDEPYALFFAIPISTPGVRLICREPVNLAERSAFDSPLGTRFDEIDATCVFDDAFVPWERVFIHDNVELSNALYDATNARHHTGHQGVVRGLAKAELLTAIAMSIAEATRSNSFLHVQEMLGEILGDLELIKGAIELAENSAQVGKWGTICPAVTPILA